MDERSNSSTVLEEKQRMTLQIHVERQEAAKRERLSRRDYRGAGIAAASCHLPQARPSLPVSLAS